MSVWLAACIIVLFFEGAMVGIAPKAWKRMMQELTTLPDHVLRKTGLAMAAVAVVLLFIAHIGM